MEYDQVAVSCIEPNQTKHELLKCQDLVFDVYIAQATRPSWLTLSILVECLHLSTSVINTLFFQMDLESTCE